MSEKRLLADYLNDIVESIADISDFTSGHAREDFIKDKKTVEAANPADVAENAMTQRYWHAIIISRSLTG